MYMRHIIIFTAVTVFADCRHDVPTYFEPARFNKTVVSPIYRQHNRNQLSNFLLIDEHSLIFVRI